jgi:hypothetical protein
MHKTLISLTQEQHALLKAIAKAKGVSMSEVLRRILDDFLGIKITSQQEGRHGQSQVRR